MKRNLLTILSLLVMSLMLSTTGAYAQSYAKANVPFAFNVGAAQLPAGTYEIKVLSQSPTAIMIQNPETGAAALSIARREGPRKTENKLVFHRVGTQYFLTEAWNSSGAGGIIVPTSKREKELKKELGLARSPSGDYEEVAVALK
jgi:hypothetical protein